MTEFVSLVQTLGILSMVTLVIWTWHKRKSLELVAKHSGFDRMLESEVSSLKQEVIELRRKLDGLTKEVSS